MQCASKDVLEAAAALAEIAPLDAYRRLLARSVNGFAELNSVAELDDNLLAKFYGSPAEQPRFFTVERGGHDVAKLAAALGIDIVLLRRLAGECAGCPFFVPPLTTASAGKKGHTIYFDTRADNFAFGGGDLPALFLELWNQNKLQSTHATPAQPSFVHRDLPLRELTDGGPAAELDGECLARLLVRAAGRGCYSGSEPCADVTDLLMAGMSGTLHGGCGKIFLGAYLGCGDHTRSRTLRSKVRILGSIPASPDAPPPAPAPPGKPPEPPMLVVLRSFPGGRARFALQRMKGGYREEKMPPGDRGELATPRRAPPQADEDGLYRAACRCLECAGSDSLLPNFSFDSAAVKAQRRREGLGPRVRQRAYRTYPDVKRQLRLLRLDSPENLAAVDRCVTLSLAAFDIESITYEPGDDHVLDANLEIEPVTSIRMDSSVRRVQKICLIGHHDNLMRERGEGVRVFRARTNDEEVVARYADFFLERRREAASEKALLLAPLYEVVDAFELAHEEFCTEHRKEQRFKSTLVGELQASLDMLRDRFYIFGLHSKGYDNVLLAKPLASARASAAGRRRSDFGYQRHGNKIRNMHVGKVMFRDLTDLTGPTSLSEIAATCGLAEKKGIFPFDILDSLEALDKPELPSKCAAWRSELNNRGPTQEEVDQALLEFRQLGCSTVGEFLEAYLKTDVTLTLDCACRLLEKFEKKLSINPILQSKLTISSYAHAVVHARLEADKAPAMFSPSVPSTYALLRNANKGGLVCVLRNVCDPDDRSEGAAVNGHLLRGLQRRAAAERPLPPPRKLTLEDEVASEVLSRHPEGLPLDNPPGLSILPPETRR